MNMRYVLLLLFVTSFHSLILSKHKAQNLTKLMPDMMSEEQ